MKRAEVFWQASVLFLVFLMTAGVYVMLAWALLRFRGGGQGAEAAVLPKSPSAIQIAEPQSGMVFQHGAQISVRAIVSEPSLPQVELQVDGVRETVEINPAPQVTPWIAEWVWEDAGEGISELVVLGQRPGGAWELSSPVTVTVVPSGTLFFASNRDGIYAIYAMRSDGREPNRLTPGPGVARQPAWRQDGALAFVSETGAGQSVIRTLDADGNLEGASIVGRDVTWTPDGRRMAYAASFEGISQIFTDGVEGKEPVAVTDEDVYAGQPSWSPDGQSLAYVAEREGNLDIWTVALDDGEPQRITDDPATDWAPDWSPDGSRLAFVSNRGGSHQIYTMQADGADVKPLTEIPRGAEAPAWSPDGHWLAFVAYSGDGVGSDAREIYLIRADGQNEVRLTRNAYDDSEPQWVWIP
jgi:hypothetical protein